MEKCRKRSSRVVVGRSVDLKHKVDDQLVDKSIPTSQRNIDSQLTSVNPRNTVAPQRDETRNEVPRQWSDVNLQDVGLGFEADEEISSDLSVEKKFDKVEFLNEFQKAIIDMISHMIMKDTEEPHVSKHSKKLHEKKAMPPPKMDDTNSVTQ